MTLWHDLRLAARILYKDRWYTAVAVLALGLGIGLNSTVFTFVNAVLLRGLPYQDSHRIMALILTVGLERQIGASYPDYEEWRAHARTFEDLGAWRSGTMNVSDAERAAERLNGVWVSANTFGILGQQPLLGRNFLPGEDKPGSEPVAIIGYGIWQTRYGGDPSILGRTLRVNEIPVKIVGVMPQGMKFPFNSDMWQPLVPDEAAMRRSTRALGVFGRLKNGVTVEQAQAEMTSLTRSIAARYPESNKDVGVDVLPYNDRFNGGEIRLVFLALMGAVGLVLVIACANVANLLLARSATRAREMALRVSLGATRWRIVRQLLIESIVLGCLAGLLGLVLSYVGVRLFDEAVRSVNKPYWIQFTMDGTVLAFLAGVCVLTGVLFGLAPALQVSRANVNELLKEGGRSGAASIRSHRFSSVMVVAEVALTLVLLVGAGLMVGSYLKFRSMEYGFDGRYLLGAAMSLAEKKWEEAPPRVRLQEQVLERVRTVPGVAAATITSTFPLGGGAQRDFEIDGQPITDRTRAPKVVSISIAEGYFETLGLTLRRGRLFTAADGLPGAGVAIVNERFVSQFLQGSDAVGRRFRMLNADTQNPWLTIVGVSPNVRQNNPQEIEIGAVIYQPFRQEPSRNLGILVRSAASPAAVAQPIRAAVREVNPDQPLYNLKTFDELMIEQSWLWRIFGTLFAVFASIALLLSAVGLYAVTAYSVAQRTQEIGVRMALGAERRQVSWMILRRGLAQLALGTALGLVGAYFVSAILQSLLIQMSARDPMTFITITALLVVITVLACLLPARRAMRVDPVIALRAE